jgi:hypothetical protein
MPNGIKYNINPQTYSLKKGNFWIATGDVDKGPTSSTDYWSSITPPTGGYTIYLNKGSNGPSIYTAADDASLITVTKQISGTQYSTAADCLNWFITQTDKMVFNRDYPSITTDGLVLNLDAGFTSSYPKINTTWYDTSSSSSNSTLTNGPTYDTVVGGNIIFDGSDDYCPFYAPNLGTTTTVEMWTKCISLSGKMFFGWNVYDVWTNGDTIGYNTGNGDVYGMSSGLVSSLGIVGNWKHLVFEMRSDVSYTNNKIYVNSANQSLSQQYSSENTGTRNFNSGYGTICGWLASSGYYMNQQVSTFRVYNRALTQTEITQNYNAQKARYGL